MSTKTGTVEIGGRTYISTRELAERLGVSLKTIWRWQLNGVLPAAFKVGRRVQLYPEDRIAAWLESHQG